MSTDSIPDIQLSYKFPDPTDPTHFQTSQPSSKHTASSDHHPPSSDDFTPSTPSMHLPSSSRPSPPPSTSVSLVNSDHQLETDWSILSLKNQSSVPLQNHSPIVPVYHEDIKIAPEPASDHPLQLTLLPDQSTKCQKWLENLTNTSDFSYQVSEHIAPSSPDRLYDLSRPACELRQEDNASQPENHAMTGKSSVGSAGRSPLECFLDPSMDLSSSYLEPEQLAKAPPAQLQSPAPSKPVESQVSLPHKSNPLPDSRLGDKLDDNNPLSHTSPGGASPNVPSVPNDSRGSLWLNRWSLLHLVWPLFLALFISSMYSKHPEQVVNPVREAIEVVVPSSEVSEKDPEASDGSIEVASTPDAIDPPSIEIQEKEEHAHNDPMSHPPTPEVHHEPEELLDKTTFVDPELAVEVASDQVPSIVDFEELRLALESAELALESELETTRLDDDRDPLSTRRDRDEAAAIVVEPHSHESLLMTPQLDASAPFPTIPLLILLVLLGVVLKKYFINEKPTKSEGKIVMMTEAEIMSNIDEKRRIDVEEITMMCSTEMNKLIKSLENRIRLSKETPELEVRLLEWCRRLTGHMKLPQKLHGDLSGGDEYETCLLQRLLDFPPSSHTPAPIIKSEPPPSVTNKSTKSRKISIAKRNVCVKKEDDDEEVEEEEDGNLSDRTIQPDIPSSKNKKNKIAPRSSFGLVPKKKQSVGGRKSEPNYLNSSSSPDLVAPPPPPRRTSTRLKKPSS